jgi:bisphosphoglycerate-independent phosphoglycerate mutase (AlkP superfamily)
MHGFIPDSKDSYAAFIIKSSTVNKSLKLRKSRKLVDLFPTVLDMMDLSAPASNKGKSILRDI